MIGESVNKFAKYVTVVQKCPKRCILILLRKILAGVVDGRESPRIESLVNSNSPRKYKEVGEDEARLNSALSIKNIYRQAKEMNCPEDTTRVALSWVET